VADLQEDAKIFLVLNLLKLFVYHFGKAKHW